MAKLLYSFCIVVLLQACSSVGTTNVEKSAIENSRVFNVGYEQAWLGVVDWFATHNISIDKMQKESGFINAEYELGMDLKDLSCGEPTGNQGFYTAKFEDAYGILNVTVRALEQRKTRVTVNFFGRVNVVTRNVFGGILQSGVARCHSKGIIEDSILNSIATETP